MDNYVGKKLDRTCPACKQGWLHQYPQDKPGTHRCGRCGEIDEKTVRANIGKRDLVRTTFDENAIIKTAAKPATNRKEA